jgi:predicted amidohydrolase YtcJ
MKIFMDPVFPSAARLKFSPDGHVEHTGVRYYTQEEADELVLNAHRRGMQVAIHALGAWAVEQALNSFERALREHPVEEPRFRIEHGGSLTLEQLKREASLGVIASLQPSFIYGMNESYLARIQEDGDQILAYPLRTMLSEVVVVAASSDNPCAALNPLLGLYSIVTRKTRYLSQPVVAEEAVTAEEGLRMYTLGAAYAMNREHEVGSLEVGKRADMAVLSHDPTAVSPDAIKDLVVERTYVDGQTVYQR